MRLSHCKELDFLRELGVPALWSEMAVAELHGMELAHIKYVDAL